MDYGFNLLFLIVFGLIGFVLSKFIGFDIYRIFSDLLSAFLIISIIVIMFPAILNPEKAIETIPNFIEFFIGSLPGVVVGDIAGSVIAGFTE